MSCMFSTSLVAGPMQTIKIPVARGSSVPACPTLTRQQASDLVDQLARGDAGWLVENENARHQRLAAVAPASSVRFHRGLHATIERTYSIGRHGLLSGA